jgi:hypothetical protein
VVAALATLVVVTVFAAGGPPDRHERPGRGGFPGVTVDVTYAGGRAASLETNRRGLAYLRLPAGKYEFATELGPSMTNVPHLCSQPRAVAVRGALMRLGLYCSIP